MDARLRVLRPVAALGLAAGLAPTSRAAGIIPGAAGSSGPTDLADAVRILWLRSRPQEATGIGPGPALMPDA